MSNPRRTAFLVALRTAAVLTIPVPALCDGLTLRYEPTYSYTTSWSEDAAGNESSSRAEGLGQRFNLLFDRAFTPALRLSGAGQLRWDKVWSVDDAGTHRDNDSRLWSGNTNLAFGSSLLGGSAGYSHQQTEGRGSVSGQATRSPTLARDGYAVNLGWRPADLPAASIRASMDDSYDLARDLVDRRGYSLTAGLTWQPVPRVDLGYSYGYAQADDRIRDSSTSLQGHSVRASWGDSFREHRISTYLSYAAAVSQNSITSGASGGNSTTQVLPSAGLSRIEAFPDQPTRVTLQPNPALVDADTSAGAGVDLGFGRTAIGDTALRDLGVQFLDPQAKAIDLNTIYVGVDRSLPDAVVSDFQWSAYQSDDNLTWTAIAIVGPVVFPVFQNRFEITVQTTRARYVKVAVKPLRASLTLDPAYSSILVTELQLALVKELPPGTVRSTDFGGSASASLRAQLTQDGRFSYNFAFQAAHGRDLGRTTGSVLNGLSFNSGWGPVSFVSASVDRTDTLTPRSFVSETRWGGNLTVQPLPGLGAGLGYGGGYAITDQGWRLSQNGSASVQAEFYPGVSAGASGSAARSRLSTGLESRNLGAGLSVGIQPHPAFSLTGAANYAEDGSSGAGPARSQRAGQVNGTATFNPIPAFFSSVSHGRPLPGMAGTPVTSWQVGVSPFPGGGLTMTAGYNETVTLGQSRSRNWNAGIRWAFGRQRSLGVTYSRNEDFSAGARSRLEGVFVNLVLPPL